MSNDPFYFWYIIGGMTVHIEKKIFFFFKSLLITYKHISMCFLRQNKIAGLLLPLVLHMSYSNCCVGLPTITGTIVGLMRMIESTI